MYVRYLGTRACITVDDGRFLMCDREELSDAETKACELGGAWLPLSPTVDALAS